MRSRTQIYASIILILSSGCLFAVTGDTDNDGLRDEVETGTGVYVSPNNTGSNPLVADSDGDSMPDGMEVSLGTNPNSPASRIKRPNIIYILADDMGYGDVGCFWQNQRTGSMKFATPGLDAMAAEGAMLTQFYVGAAICASSRCSFLQGRNQGHADIRDTQFDFPLPARYSLAGTLKAAGYRTIHIGKAGLAGVNSRNPSAHPLNRGFDRFFGYLTHAEAHEHYPRNGTTEKAAMICDDYHFINDAYQDMFTSDVFTAFAKKEIIASATTQPDKPFFIYLSYDTPHFLDQYAPTPSYPSGSGVNGGLQWTGSPSYVNTAINDPNRVNNPANKHPSVPSNWGANAKPFVSMVRRMDESVSDILQTLRDLGIDRNTLVVFTSDNGPEPIGIFPGEFQSYANFEGNKGDLLEGGIREPAIVWWPGTIQGTSQLTNIRKIDRPCANYDWLATFADMAKTPIPSFTDGTSLLPTLSGTGSQMDRGYLYFEMYSFGNTPTYPDFPNHSGQLRNQMQAIRVGDFMGLRTAMANGTEPFKIYNVVTDTKQSTDLAVSHPDLQEKMKRIGLGGRRPLSNLPRPYDATQIPAYRPTVPVRNGLKWKSYEGNWPWLPEFRAMTPAASGDTAGISTAVRTRNEDFGLSFDGYLSITTAGSYNFQLSSDTAASLWIHESQVLDNEVDPAPAKTSGAVYLSSGLHPIRLFYRHTGGAMNLDLKYSGPGISMRSIPPAVLFEDGRPTVLQPDVFTVTRNSQSTVDVLANDSAEGPLALTAARTANFGNAAISNGRVIYTPRPNVIGIETFTYDASDGVATSTATATGTILYDNEIWFPLDEGQGFNVQQVGLTGAGSGTISGPTDPSISWIRGKSGRALRFRGVADAVNLQNLNLPLGIAPRTFSCWLRVPSGAATEKQTLLSYGTDAPGGRFTVRLAPSSTNPALQTAQLETGSGVFSGDIGVNDALWHHLVLSVADLDSDGTITMNEVRLYIDGNPDTGHVDVPGAVLTADGFTPSLGNSNHGPGYHFAGDLDEIRIFPRALTGPEASVLTSTLPITTGSATNIDVSASDYDGDGFSNDIETTAGTDPEDSSSYPRIDAMTRTPAGIQLKWIGISGRTYTIEESQDMRGWLPAAGVPPVVVLLSDTNTMITVPGNGAARRFFRLRVEKTQLPQSTTTVPPLPPGDQDGDGETDDQEYIAGTDPLNASSFLRVKSQSVTPAGIVLRWDAVAGRTYRIEESRNLLDWQTASGTAPILIEQDTPDTTAVVPPNGASRRFLRLAVSLSN